MEMNRQNNSGDQSLTDAQPLTVAGKPYSRLWRWAWRCLGMVAMIAVAAVVVQKGIQLRRDVFEQSVRVRS